MSKTKNLLFLFLEILLAFSMPILSHAQINFSNKPNPQTRADEILEQARKEVRENPNPDKPSTEAQSILDEGKACLKIPKIDLFEAIYEVPDEYAPGGGQSEKKFYKGYPQKLKALFDDAELNLRECVEKSFQCLRVNEKLTGHPLSFDTQTLEGLHSAYSWLTLSKKYPNTCRGTLIKPIRQAREKCYQTSKETPIFPFQEDTTNFGTEEKELYKFTEYICGKGGTRFYVPPTTTIAENQAPESQSETMPPPREPPPISQSGESGNTTEPQTPATDSPTQSEEEPTTEQPETEVASTDEGDDSQDEAVNPFDSSITEDDVNDLLGSMENLTELPDLANINSRFETGTMNFDGGRESASNQSNNPSNFTPAFQNIPIEEANQFRGFPANQSPNGNPGANGAPPQQGRFRGRNLPQAPIGGRGNQAAQPRPRRGGGRRAPTPSANIKYYSPSPSNLNYSPPPKEKRRLVRQRIMAKQTLAQKKFDPKAAARIINGQFKKGLQGFVVDYRKRENTPNIFQEMNFHYSIDGRNRPRKFLDPKGH